MPMCVAWLRNAPQLRKLGGQRTFRRERPTSVPKSVCAFQVANDNWAHGGRLATPGAGHKVTGRRGSGRGVTVGRRGPRLGAVFTRGWRALVSRTAVRRVGRRAIAFVLSPCRMSESIAVCVASSMSSCKASQESNSNFPDLSRQRPRFAHRVGLLIDRNRSGRRRVGVLMRKPANRGRSLEAAPCHGLGRPFQASSLVLASLPKTSGSSCKNLRNFRGGFEWPQNPLKGFGMPWKALERLQRP